MNHRWGRFGPYGVAREYRNKKTGFNERTCTRGCGLRSRYFDSMQQPYFWVEITAGVWTWAQFMPPCGPLGCNRPPA